jgi:hypothetical protein
MKRILNKIWDVMIEIGEARAQRHIKFGWH